MKIKDTDRLDIEDWVRHLRRGKELTVQQFMARCLVDIRDNLIENRKSTEVQETILGAMDNFFGQMAARSGLPYAGDGDSRRKLKEERDAMRQQLQGRPDAPPIIDENNEKIMEW